jgi:purine-binding chemotaxis protein CheW
MSKKKKKKLKAGLDALFSDAGGLDAPGEALGLDFQGPEVDVLSPAGAPSPPAEAQREPTAPAAALFGQEEAHLVVFGLAGEHYGVPIGIVSSIIKRQDITVVPRAAEFIEGVTNLRGTVLPVIDLRARFGLPAGDQTKDTRIVVIELDAVQVGMVVDSVSQVMRIPAAAIEPPSPIVTTVDSAFINGIAKTEGRLVILLDMGRVLSEMERSELEMMQPA